MTKFDIIVIGAGLVGSTMALMLAKHTPFRIALIEHQPPLKLGKDDNQRVVALGALATDILQTLEVFPNLGDQHAHAYTAMHVWDEQSDGELDFAANELGLPLLGHMVDALACTQALQSAVLEQGDANVTALFDCQLDKLEINEEKAIIQSSGGEFSARLVIGADGANSWLRQQAKIFANRRNYQQRGIVAKILTAESHQDCAWQRFLRTGPVAALPIHHNQSSIVWSADEPLAAELLNMDDAQFCQALTQAFESKLGEVVMASPRQAFPLVSQQADRYFAPSLALIGDAAHSIHPLAGQGANLGFKDAQALLQLIANCDKPEQIGCLNQLYRYQQQRKPDNAQTDWLMTALNASYRFDLPLWLSARGAGMNWLNRSQRLKTLLASQAIGL